MTITDNDRTALLDNVSTKIHWLRSDDTQISFMHDTTIQASPRLPALSSPILSQKQQSDSTRVIKLSTWIVALGFGAFAGIVTGLIISWPTTESSLTPAATATSSTPTITEVPVTITQRVFVSQSPTYHWTTTHHYKQNIVPYTTYSASHTQLSTTASSSISTPIATSTTTSSATVSATPPTTQIITTSITPPG